MSHIENIPFLVFTTPIREGLRWSAKLAEALSNWVDHFGVSFKIIKECLLMNTIQRNMELLDCYTSEDGLGDLIQQIALNMNDVAEVSGDFFDYCDLLRQ